jgi:hypothetical protein
MKASAPYSPRVERDYTPKYPAGYVPREQAAITLTDSSTFQPAREARSIEQAKISLPVNTVERSAKKKRGYEKKPESETGKLRAILQSEPRGWSTREMADLSGLTTRKIRNLMFNDLRNGDIVVEPHPDVDRKRLYRWVGA